MREVVKKFKLPSFIFCLISIVLILIIFHVLGNLQISKTYLYWHHIPEMVALYLFGIWAKEAGMPFKLVLLAYISTVLVTPITISPLVIADGLLWALTSIIGAFLAFPFLLGYYIQKEVIG